MRLRVVATALLSAALLAIPARADEVGGGGFSVPQDEWLWGVEGLVRTPVDLSVDVGVTFYGWEIEGEAQHDEGPGDPFPRPNQRLDIEPEAIEAGFRIAGGIGYWSCCVLIEPAMSFRGNRPFGDERSDSTPRAIDPSEQHQFAFADLEIKRGWDLAFGPQMTWIITEDAPLLGSPLGLAGLPLVFFPYLGVAHVDWEAQLNFHRNGSRGSVLDRDFEDDMFLVGFDLDIPLPGSHADFTHALTFGFRWVESDEQHDMGPFPGQTLGDGGTGTSSGACGDGTASSGSAERSCFIFEGTDGWRVGLYYRVTWNDFEGFVKRNIFGPMN